MYATIRFDNLPDFMRVFGRCVTEIRTGCQRGVKMGLGEAVTEMLAVRRWKNRTGATEKATRGRVTMVTRDGAEGVLECAVDNASYLNDGTVPHIIRPKMPSGTSPRVARKLGRGVRASDDIGTFRVALRWYDGSGNPVFRREVHHPGTKGDKFFDKGTDKCRTVMVREISISVVQAQRILDA